MLYPSDTNATEWSFYGKRIYPSVVRHPFPGETSSVKTSQTAYRWLQECISGHVECARRHTNRLPTRLIDVEAIRICITREGDTTETFGSYACLSHCWGSGIHATKVLRTTTATLAAHMEALTWNMLPRTFQEAILFTRSLDIPYLWIDSLCIIQDDKLDWEQEGANMADIYSNCQICLSASLSPNSKGGLFMQGHFGGCQVGVVRDHNGRDTPLFLRVAPPHLPEGSYYPLATRAWVVQEDMLSPRTLYFVGTEIIYECRQSYQCECGAARSRPNRKKRSTDLKKHWFTIMGRYSQTSMTFSKDALPAIAGVARQSLLYRPGDTYLAGLWRSTLLWDLQWQCSNSGTRSRRRTRPWRAPSWSWASMEFATISNAPARYSWRPPIVEILDAYCASSGFDPMGTVAFGHILLRGKAFDARLCYDEKAKHQLIAQAKGNWFIVSSSHDQFQLQNDCIALRCHMDLAISKPGRDYVPNRTTVKLLFMDRPSHARTSSWEYWALLVLKPLYAETYERIGIVDGDFPSTARHTVLSQTFDDAPTGDYFIV
jgi:hypothetical protein